MIEWTDEITNEMTDEIQVEILEDIPQVFDLELT
jgi:hypothetical protein